MPVGRKESRGSSSVPIYHSLIHAPLTVTRLLNDPKSRIYNDNNIHDKDFSTLTQGNSDEEDEDLSKLRKVPDKIPPAVWLISIVSLFERYAYYGIIGILRESTILLRTPRNKQNMIVRHLHRNCKH